MNPDLERPPTPAKRMVRIIFLAVAAVLVASIIFVYQVGLIGIRAERNMAHQLVVLQAIADFLSF